MTKVLLGLSLVMALIPGFGRRPRLTPDQQLSVLRMQIVKTAQDVEAAHDIGLTSKTQYTGSKKIVLKAVRSYNSILKRFKRYGHVARSEKQQLLILLASIAIDRKQHRAPLRMKLPDKGRRVEGGDPR